ncbi:MAG: helix-turn-helix domain-containing protein [Candidatus Merdivicinus sp.]
MAEIQVLNTMPARMEGVYLHQCGMEHCIPGHSFGPAVRDHTLIHLVLSGCGKFYVDGKVYSITAGQGFLILPGIVTTYTADLEDPWSYCWVGFSGRDVPAILQQCGIGGQMPVFSFPSIEEMQECVTALRECVKPDANPFRITARLFDFFSLLYSTSSSAAKTRGILEAAVDYTARNFSYHITVEDMAHHLGVDRSHLFRIFKKGMGCSPQEYLLDFKLSRAAAMLHQTQLSVTEVMYSCGFSDPPNFSRQFKKKYGMPPARFRMCGTK